MKSVIERRDSLVTVTALVARIAGVTSADVDPSMPFALLGIDSVGTIELAVAVEEAFGIELPQDASVECRDARSLATRIDALLDESRPARASTDPLTAMLADAVLPDDVGPSPVDRPTGLPAHRSTEQTLLITGATGFLGRWLARELLERTDATLFCLVRSGQQHAARRLQDALVDTGVDASRINGRVHALEGDLSQPYLGLPRAEFERLAGMCDAVCHAGAAVNWVLPYSALRQQNVAGTLELLRLAARRGLPFHFVSSLSVCYSTTAPRFVDEGFDPLSHLAGVHLGYAQTKVVAEALVQEAGRRGLPVTISRPSFISGHSETGEFNPDDILARVVAGCVRMRTAPDLDWVLDCTPVDVVARQILDLANQPGVFHLRHPAARHWRECVLWLRLYGYDVSLVPYHAWLRQLDRETCPGGDPSHPLRPLRSFFLSHVADSSALTLPEVMLGTRGASHNVASTTHTSVKYPPLDASLLQRYCDAFVASGHLPAPPSRGRPTRSSAGSPLDCEFFSRALGKRVTSVEPRGTLSDHSIIGELTAWQSGRPTGLFVYEVWLDDEERPRELIVKIKAADRDSIAVGEALARLCDAEIGDAYARSAHRVGLTASHLRELAIYQQRDRRFADHAPAMFGTVADESNGTWTLVMERIQDAVVRDSVERVDDWMPSRIEGALSGLAALHAIWFQRDRELLSAPWIGHVSTAADVADMSDLWRALASHATPRFSAWADPQIGTIQRHLIDGIERWRPVADELPRTLIHNDFNPRNICLRRDTLKLVAYDWELATLGLPQHDLAELLCFVLPPTASDADIDAWIEAYRLMLERECGVSIDAGDWERGFRASLYDLMINRLPMYALVHRIRPQPFLPRIVRTWRRIYERRAFDSRG